ncbi:MAG: leucine-rich repeat domain-containing protein [Clostridiales bacterium]|nr:leucine-rich repeat domain-containing protein [Clostridiales bacterium]
MTVFKKVMFIVILSIFVIASVYLSFTVISRDTYEYEQQTDVGGTGVDGLVFCGFNGNLNTSEVRVYHPFVKNKNRTGDNDAFVEDGTRTVVAIDKFTFVSDENMQYCYVGPDVAYIDEQAFFGCFALRAIIVDDANEYYTDVDGVLYTKDKTEILLYPTYHTEYLVKIGKVPENYYETHDETYEIPEGVKRIATGCFYKTWGIKEITLPSTLESIGDMAFFKCESMLLTKLPDSLKEMGNDSFSYCKSMTGALFVPESVDSIGHHCFYKCEKLTGFYMGDKDESTIALGGKWQPKGENAFSAKPPVFGAVRADVESLNLKALEEASKTTTLPEDK